MTTFDITAFVGLPEEDLLSIKLDAVNTIKNGGGSVQYVSSINRPGLSLTYFQGWSPTDVLAAANYALKKMEKKTIRKTYAQFI